MRRVFFTIAMLGTLLCAGCDKGKELAKTTDRLAGYIGTGLSIVDRLQGSGSISTESAIAATEAFRQLNLMNGQLITETKAYLVTDDQGNVVLALPADGKQKLLAIVGTGQGALVKLLQDPRFLSISPDKRKQLNRTINDVGETLKSIIELINAAKSI